jgi:diguanylate cyclase (GGDEF)-like protein
VPGAPPRPSPPDPAAALAELADSREEIARAWLARHVERAGLSAVAGLPLNRLAAELPDLIGELARGAAAGEQRGAEAGERVAALVGGEPEAVARELASLHAAMAGRLLFCGLGRAELHEALEALALAFVGAPAAPPLPSAPGQTTLGGVDELTGLYDETYLQRQLGHLLRIHQRYGPPFSVLLLDVDGLERINAAHGRATGNDALVAVAGAIRSAISSSDRAVRLPGDEFCVLAHRQTARQAAELAERIAAAVEAAEAPQGVSLAVAIGVVSCPEHAAEAELLLEHADSAMFRAKAAGERVAVGPGEPAPKPRRT